jgi:hypothetical protein
MKQPRRRYAVPSRMLMLASLVQVGVWLEFLLASCGPLPVISLVGTIAIVAVASRAWCAARCAPRERFG